MAGKVTMAEVEEIVEGPPPGDGLLDPDLPYYIRRVFSTLSLSAQKQFSFMQSNPGVDLRGMIETHVGATY